jgi:signal transduction histidine kinase
MGLLFIGVLLLLLQITVIGPMGRLTAHTIAVGQSGDLSARLSLRRRDEIGTLAQEFDRMVEQLAEARWQVVEQTYRAGMAEMAAGVLHNGRNALSPLVARIDSLSQTLRKAPLEQIEMAQAELANDGSSPQRREDLGQFLELAHKSLTATVQKMREEVADLKNRASQVEQILVQPEQASHAEKPLEQVDLHQLLQESLQMMPDSLRSNLSVEIDPSVLCVGAVRTHRITLLQVFANLLNNAGQAIQRGKGEPGEISIRAQIEPAEEGEMVHLQIRDNGAGIAPEHLDKIFQRGFTTRNGSGLGLHWSANAVNAMQGRLYAESPGPGQGACLHLLIPRNR